MKSLNLSGENKTTRCANIPNLGDYLYLLCLELSCNSIERIINVEHLRYLQQLNLSQNKIRVIENLQQLTALTELDLSHNLIERVPPQISANVALQVVLLAHNSVAEQQSLQNLRALSNLRVLDLRSNPVQQAPEYRRFLESAAKRQLVVDQDFEIQYLPANPDDFFLGGAANDYSSISNLRCETDVKPHALSRNAEENTFSLADDSKFKPLFALALNSSHNNSRLHDAKSPSFQNQKLVDFPKQQQLYPEDRPQPVEDRIKGYTEFAPGKHDDRYNPVGGTLGTLSSR